MLKQLPYARASGFIFLYNLFSSIAKYTTWKNTTIKNKGNFLDCIDTCKYNRFFQHRLKCFISALWLLHMLTYEPGSQFSHIHVPAASHVYVEAPFHIFTEHCNFFSVSWDMNLGWVSGPRISRLSHKIASRCTTNVFILHFLLRFLLKYCKEFMLKYSNMYHS